MGRMIKIKFPKESLLLNGCLIILAAVLAYLQFGKENILIRVIVIMMIALISILIGIINYRDKVQSDTEIKALTIKLDASKQIQEAQLAELKSLRQETNMLQEMGKTQLQATFYTEELNHNIGKVLLRIKLNNRMPFQDLCPIGFLFEIDTRSNIKMKYRSFIDNGNTFNNELMMESYKVYYVQDNGKCTGGHIFGHLTTEVENIIIELDYPSDTGLLKDFHDEKLHMYLPENILKQSIFVELVVNGWAILHRDINRSDWSKLEKSHMAIMWPEFNHNELELYQNWNEDRNIQHYTGWLIDLYSNIPRKHAAGTSRWAGF